VLSSSFVRLLLLLLLLLCVITLSADPDAAAAAFRYQSDEFLLRAQAGIPAREIVAAATIGCAELFMQEAGAWLAGQAAAAAAAAASWLLLAAGWLLPHATHSR
jgi:hypothetical protein